MLTRSIILLIVIHHFLVHEPMHGKIQTIVRVDVDTQSICVVSGSQPIKGIRRHAKMVGRVDALVHRVPGIAWGHIRGDYRKGHWRGVSVVVVVLELVVFRRGKQGEGRSFLSASDHGTAALRQDRGSPGFWPCAAIVLLFFGLGRVPLGTWNNVRFSNVIF